MKLLAKILLWALAVVGLLVLLLVGGGFVIGHKMMKNVEETTCQDYTANLVNMEKIMAGAKPEDKPVFTAEARHAVQAMVVGSMYAGLKLEAQNIPMDKIDAPMLTKGLDEIYSICTAKPGLQPVKMLQVGSKAKGEDLKEKRAVIMQEMLAGVSLTTLPLNAKLGEMLALKMREEALKRSLGQPVSPTAQPTK